jgi:hypothetical protein
MFPISTTSTTLSPITTTIEVISVFTTNIITIATLLATKSSSGCNPNLHCYTSSTTTSLPTNLICAKDINNTPVCIENFICMNKNSCTTNTDCKQGEVCIFDCCPCPANDPKCTSRHCAQSITGCFE